MSKNPWHHLFHNLKQQHLNLSDQQRTQFSRAHARLRIAKRFHGITLIDVSDTTERGYSTGMAIFLAYSGMEALAAAMREQVHQWEMNDEKLALKLRKLLAGLDLNQAQTTGSNRLASGSQQPDPTAGHLEKSEIA